MIVNEAALAAFFRGLQTAFQGGLALANPIWQQVAMLVPSSTETEDYAWLQALPSIRKWVGDKYIHNLAASGYKLTNEEFEGTFGIKRSKLEDDTFGVFKNIGMAWGGKAALWPDRHLFPLLNGGWENLCFDGLPFFSATHPWQGGVQSNTGGGSGTPWYLLDTSQPGIKSLVFQEREKPHLVEMAGQSPARRNTETNSHTFMRGELLYSIEARGAFG